MNGDRTNSLLVVLVILCVLIYLNQIRRREVQNDISEAVAHYAPIIRVHAPVWGDSDEYESDNPHITA